MKRPLGVRSRRWLLAAVTLPALLVACSTDPTSPGPDTHTISGGVSLQAEGRDAAGALIQTFSIRNASGVPVSLVRNGRVQDTTRTIGGHYEFRGRENGTYQVVATFPGAVVETTQVTVSGADTSVPDTLRLWSVGDLVASPNPSSTQFTLAFSTTSSDTVRCGIYSPSGTLVRNLFEGRVLGWTTTITWNGRDDTDTPVANGPYCAVTRQGTDVHLTILHRCVDSSCWPLPVAQELR